MMEADSTALPLVYAVTVNWQRPDDTLECLVSLYTQDYPQLKVLVVDNGSQDGSVERFRERYPQAEILALPENLGFAGGYNRGIQTALERGAQFVFILNNDATVAPEAVRLLVESHRPDIGLLAPLIFYTSAPDHVWSAGGRISRWTLEKDDRWTNRSDWQTWPASIEQDFVTGCSVLFPRATLLQVGAFDEAYRMYYEDMDLCYRVRKSSKRILLIPAAHAWHKVATSSGGRDSPQERYWMARSSVMFFRKHARGLQKAIIPIYRSLSAVKTTLKLLIQGRTASISAYWRGLWHGLTGRGGDWQ
jgi:GT2 family glycosyltransferase